MKRVCFLLLLICAGCKDRNPVETKIPSDSSIYYQSQKSILVVSIGSSTLPDVYAELLTKNCTYFVEGGTMRGQYPIQCTDTRGNIWIKGKT